MDFSIVKRKVFRRKNVEVNFLALSRLKDLTKEAATTQVGTQFFTNRTSRDAGDVLKDDPISRIDETK